MGGGTSWDTIKKISNQRFLIPIEMETVTLNRVRIALLNLIIVVSLGAFIRFQFFSPIKGINITYLHHAHSHMAFLGWVFMALFTLIAYLFLSEKRFVDKSYTYLYYVMQAANFGMLFTFPFYGYSPWSIAFSSLHTISAVIFTIILISDLKKEYVNENWPMSIKFIISGLVFIIISNFAPFALGPITSIYGKSDAYYLLVNFYLHFQYNGWFTFAILGVVLKVIESYGLDTNHLFVKRGFMLKLISIFPAFGISVLATKPEIVWHWASISATVIQSIGLLYLIVFALNSYRQIMSNSRPILLLLLAIGGLSLLLQHILQVFGSMPFAVDLLINRQIVIAYLHLVFVGFATSLLLYQFINLGFFKVNILLRFGVILFLLSFGITEVILVVRSKVVDSNLWLFQLAIMQLLGILFIVSQIKMRASFHVT